MALKAKAIKARVKVPTVQEVMEALDYKKEDEAAVRLYVEANIEQLVLDYAEDAKQAGQTPQAHAIALIQNAVYDDAFRAEDSDVAVDVEGDDEQPIEEVSQDVVKNALKALLVKQNDMIAFLYQKHEEYNEAYFSSKLSVPLITIDKLSNRTLGNYTAGKDAMAIENHIRFNRNFIALNTEERILETLRHEMIHQWQDEVLYVRHNTAPIEVDIPKVDGDSVTMEKGLQKRRPKDWHNKDFKDMARVVNIVARGNKCTGNPAKMPEPQSYNRKFSCQCIASNGYPLTIWSTRQVHAVCMVCEQPFREKQKGGKVIEVRTSHIEKPGEDAIEIEMTKKYRYFEKFATKGERDEYLEHADPRGDGNAITEMEEGTYQREHNAFKEGFAYWVAYNTDEVIPDVVLTTEVEELEAEAPVEVPKKRGRKPKAPGAPIATPAVEVETEEPASEPKKLGRKPKAPDAVEAVEAPASEPKKRGRKPKPKTEETPAPKKRGRKPVTRSIDNPQDIIDLYRVLGTAGKVAEFFGKTPATISNRIKKFGINFQDGTFVTQE